MTPAARLLRLALAATYLSAVADRFGLWGPPGAPGVVWGDWTAFVAYTALLNPWTPGLAHPLAVIATAAEILIALALLAGFMLRKTALASAALLAAFAIGMIAGVGVKAPLDYSVFTALAASLLLAERQRSDARRGDGPAPV